MFSRNPSQPNCTRAHGKMSFQVWKRLGRMMSPVWHCWRRRHMRQLRRNFLTVSTVGTALNSAATKLQPLGLSPQHQSICFYQGLLLKPGHFQGRAGHSWWVSNDLPHPFYKDKVLVGLELNSSNPPVSSSQVAGSTDRLRTFL